MKSILTYPKVCFTVLLLIVVVTSYGQEQSAKRKSIRLSANAGFFNEWRYKPLKPIDYSTFTPGSISNSNNSSLINPNFGQFIGVSADYFFMQDSWFLRFGLQYERTVERDLSKVYTSLSKFLSLGRGFYLKKIEISPYAGIMVVPRPALSVQTRMSADNPGEIESQTLVESQFKAYPYFFDGWNLLHLGADISLPIGENKKLGLRLRSIFDEEVIRMDASLNFSYDFLAKHKTPPSQLLSSPQFFFSMGTGYMKEYKNDEEVEALTPNSAMIYSFTAGVMNRKRWFFQFSYDLEDTREKDLNKNFLLRAMHFSVGKEFQWNQQEVRFFTGTSSIRDIGIWWRKESASSKRVLKESPQKIANLFYLLGLEVSTPIYRELHIGLRTKWITDFSNFGRTDLSAFLAYTL